MSSVRFVVVLVLAIAACSNDVDEPELEAPPLGRGPDKADTTGSCVGSGCDGQAMNGTCWCDEMCARYGDCCSDRVNVCEAPPPPPPSGGSASVPELGMPETRQLTVIATSADGLDAPRDLAFHPDRPNELWTVNLGFEGVVILFAPGTPSQRADVRHDSHASHFMASPASLAFGDDGHFATCGESRNGGNDFMGPVLWDSDLAVFARVNQGGPLLGSHIDMLHQSPLCMGIEHAGGNGYWTFDGLAGHVVYYDFQEDHGPGYDDHADGIVRRYTEARVTRRSGIGGHLVLDRSSGWLYVADSGGRRVIRLDTASGRPTWRLRATNEPLAEFTEYSGANVEIFASGLSAPSGMALANGRLFVSDEQTGEIIGYDIASRQELGRVATGAAAIMGLAFGPDGKLWYVDAAANTVVRLDP